MATATAELRRFHVCDRPVRELGTNQDVYESDHDEEPRNASECSLSIEIRLNESFFYLALAEIDSDRHQSQPGKKHDWKNEKNDDSGIRVTRMTADLQRKDEEP